MGAHFKTIQLSIQFFQVLSFSDFRRRLHFNMLATGVSLSGLL